MAKQRVKKERCPNCDHPLQETAEFCSQCGQENHDINRPFKYLFWEILEGAFNLDSRTWTSLRTLFRYPGKMALEFNAGKRKSYVPPVRFFLLSSIVFFLLLSINPFGTEEMTKVNVDSLFEDRDTLPINLGFSNMRMSKAEYLAIFDYNDDQVDSFLVSKSLSPSFYNRKMTKGFPRVLNNLPSFQQRMYKNFSIAVFFLVPIFAFLLHLFYLRQKNFYVEHLILGLNYHAFFFLTSSILIILGWIAFSDITILISFLCSFIYLMFALKRFHQQRWGKTILKSFLLFFSYFIITSVVMIFASLIAVILF
ncbi:MAG: DUF3667 domain-containing protein [Saprospiraceae bacterium]